MESPIQKHLLFLDLTCVLSLEVLVRHHPLGNRHLTALVIRHKTTLHRANFAFSIPRSSGQSSTPLMETIEEQMLPLKRHDGLCPEGKLLSGNSGSKVNVLPPDRTQKSSTTLLCSNEKRSPVRVSHCYALP